MILAGVSVDYSSKGFACNEQITYHFVCIYFSKHPIFHQPVPMSINTFNYVTLYVIQPVNNDYLQTLKYQYQIRGIFKLVIFAGV